MNTEHPTGAGLNNQTNTQHGGGVKPVRSAAFEAASRSLRKALCHHRFPEPAASIMDKVLRYGLEKGELKAVIPNQKCFTILCGLDKHQVSKAISLLRLARVLVVEQWDRGRSPRWDVYSITPPDKWKLPMRVEESAALNDLDKWLERLALDQLEFLAPPPSLDDLLAELFVERSAQSGRVASNPIPGSSSNSGPCRGGFESSRVIQQQRPRISHGQTDVEIEVLPQAAGESCLKDNLSGAEPVVLKTTTTGKVVLKTTPERVPIYTRAPVDRIDRLIESRSTALSIDRSKDPVVFKTTAERSEHQRYVEDRLFRLIGEHERTGRMASTWLDAVERMPNRLDELVSTVEAMSRERRLKTSPVRWLNCTVRNALQMKAGK